jgi:hypothetical protein
VPKSRKRKEKQDVLEAGTGWAGVTEDEDTGGKGTWPLSGTYQKSHALPKDSPAGDNDDILCNASHLLDGQIAHPTECGLGKTWGKALCVLLSNKAD